MLQCQKKNDAYACMKNNKIRISEICQEMFRSCKTVHVIVNKKDKSLVSDQQARDSFDKDFYLGGSSEEISLYKEQAINVFIDFLDQEKKERKNKQIN